MTDRVVCDEELRAHPDLLGLPLASPARRIAGFLLDLFVLVIPSTIVAVVAAFVSLSVTDPAALQAIRGILQNRDPAEASEGASNLGNLAPLLVQMQAPGLPPSVAVAVADSDLQRAGDLLTGYSFEIVLSLSERSRPLKPRTIQFHLGRVIPRLFRGAALLGTAALYFTFFASGRRQSTLGKRLAGTRVVRLDGRSLSAWEGFERFGGYFATLGTFGLGLLDLWRDRNRRLAHDRICNTVVVRNAVPSGTEAAAVREDPEEEAEPDPSEGQSAPAETVDPEAG